MDNDNEDIFDDNGNKFPNYWKLFGSFTLGELKTARDEMAKTNPDRKGYFEYMMANSQNLVHCYINGLRTGIPLSLKIPFEEFSIFVYIIDVIKGVKKPKVELRPEPMKPTNSELETLFKADKIQKEIDDIYNGLE